MRPVRKRVISWNWRSTGSSFRYAAFLAAAAFSWAQAPQPTYKLSPKLTAKALALYSPQQVSILEKLNRADRSHLTRLPQVVVPDTFGLDELDYSPLPRHNDAYREYPKFILVDLAQQAFGAYELGELVRWGPVSTGDQDKPTVDGDYHLNWKSRFHVSTVNERWKLRWYFNFDNKRGRGFHAYPMPGFPASHSCIRLLDRDARWLYDWGEGWTLDEKEQQIKSPGTPVSLAGKYDFGAPPPWRTIK